MLDVFMSVYGEDIYFEMARYSINSWLENNPDTKLNVVTDRPSLVIQMHEKVNVYDNKVVEDVMNDKQKWQVQRIKALVKNCKFDNNGKTHIHEGIALLPLYAQVISTEDYILKVDCDSYFRGDLARHIPCDPSWECMLVARPDNGMQKPYGGGLPGVGFMLWKRGGRFVDAYVEWFTGNEQETVLKMLTENKVKFAIWEYWPAHWVYPFTWYKKNGKEFTKQIADQYTWWYIHVGGNDQLEQLKTLKGWYGGV